MRFLVISDIHANWYALEAVLADAAGAFDRIVCCGDLVGYNPHPARVIECIRQHCDSVIRGNHDKGVSGVDSLEWFNEVARAAALWTAANLESAELDYLRGLPKGPLQLDYFELCHGAPRDEDEYITNAREAAPSFAHLQLPLAFFGHTHLQGGFFSKHGRIGTVPQVSQRERELVIALEPDIVYMVNPGAVGQPRDGDPRAAYAIFDSDQKLVSLRRVDYPIQKTAEDIRKAGLPGVLSFRLFQGL
ncbi:MAG: metallophosphoesterase family protein [Acidobacteriaceae bacterium]|nr:metallophosphoesterase family protein [Acidobacteriaceae bacterium]